MSVRGVRGATTVLEDTPEEILKATLELLTRMLEANPQLKSDEVCSVFFSLTPDLKTVHPARAARNMGWTQVPLFCSQEIPVPESLPMCIRVLIHWNTNLEQREIKHVYLREAVILRPDLVTSPK